MELLYHSERPMTLSIVKERIGRQIYPSLTTEFVNFQSKPHKPHEVRASNHTALRELRRVSIQVYTCSEASRAWIRSSSSLAATSEGQLGTLRRAATPSVFRGIPRLHKCRLQSYPVKHILVSFLMLSDRALGVGGSMGGCVVVVL